MKEDHRTQKLKVLIILGSLEILKVHKTDKINKLLEMETFHDTIRANHKTKHLLLNQFFQ
jgi:hypothetical protein